MTLSSVLLRLPARRAPATRSNGIAFVVVLMMALVFAPVLVLHLAATRMEEPAAVAAVPPAAGQAAERGGRPGPG